VYWADGLHIAFAPGMALRRDALLREYQTRLNYWRAELERLDQSAPEEAAQIRSFIKHYEEQIAQLDQQHQIGAGPTLGGDGKPNIDC